jgi:hypothetical protein
MSWEAPEIADFKAMFVRDFNYGSTTDKVMDADITNAINLALIEFNSALPFETDQQATLVFMYLAAYFLVANLQTSTHGVGSQCNFPVSSKSVGGVSVSYSIPEAWLKSANLAHFTMNGYGMRYLTLVYPFTIGNVGIVEGTTTWD